VISEYNTGTGAAVKPRVWRSTDFGATWQVIYILPTNAAGEARHPHAVHYDREGRLWMSRGDTMDNWGFSDNDGDSWCWLFNEADHADVQVVGMADTQDWVFGCLDTAKGSAIVGYHKHANLHYYDKNWRCGEGDFHKRVCFLGACAGAYKTYGWAIAEQANGHLLIYQWSTGAGVFSSVYVADPTGRIMIRADEVDGAIIPGGSAMVVTPLYTFLGNSRIALTSISGSPMPEQRSGGPFNGVIVIED
jgi:hypothetical protein